jgi:hypothetical protein
MPVVTYEGTVEPGVYDMPEDVYHADPVPGGSLSASGAKLLLPPSCPAKYRYYADHGRPEKRAFDLGKVAHRLLLSTGAVYEVVQKTDRKSGEVSDAGDYKTASAQEHQAAIYAAGRTPILRKELDTAQAMADAALAHPEAGALFKPGTGLPERSAFWFDERNGITRRARFDWLPNPRPGRLLLADFKTCDHADDEACGRAIANFGYHLQGAWYLSVLRGLGYCDTDAMFVLAFQERTPPYLVNVVYPDVAAMHIGAILSQRAINIYRECRASGVWPGYDSVHPVSVPAYYENRFNEEW